jgi:uncharacterized integral membrane protein
VSTPQPPGTPDVPPAVEAPDAPPAGAAPERAASTPALEREDEEDRPSTWQPLLYLKIGLLLFAIAYSIAFVVENTDEIRIDFVFSTAKVHLIWEILLLLAVGLLGGVLLSQLYRHRRRASLAKKAGKPSDSRTNVDG